MQIYTASELEQFKVIAADIRRGHDVNDLLALKFKMWGWLRQVDDKPIKWELTSQGEAHLK